MYKELIFTGFGGQGIILAGFISGKAASIHQNLSATLTQNYGPESRGGACSAHLIVSDKAIFYPHVTKPDILVALSQEGFNQHKDKISKDGIIIIERDLVKIKEEDRANLPNIYSIPATRLAEEMGKKMVANIIALGYLTAVSKVISKEAMKEAIRESVPPGTEELNFKAFEKGYNYKEPD
jgi:2-oxoglutarate ferredoxin oxidoreductase subunit gamma